jgi:CBS-domain-containing membrane protein
MRAVRARSKLERKRGGAMKIEELMTRDVLAVRPEMSLKDVASMLAEHQISGVPVVNEQGTVPGVVSEADILVKERGPDAQHGGLVGWLLGGGAADTDRLAARTAAEAMSSPATTIGPTRDVSEAARLMLERGIKRLPVVDAVGTLLGIVTRSDLVRGFARSDEDIEREIREDVVKGTLWLDEGAVDIRVAGGEVTISGEVERRTEAELVPRFVQRVPGVVGVRSSLTWRFDDLKVRVPESDPHVPIAGRTR